MPRGRSIDRTLPVTRTLTAQRDYRARKAAHQRDLEETVARLQSENDALRAELAFLRSAQPSSSNGTTAVHLDTAPHPPGPAPNPALAEQQLAAVAAAHAQLASALHALEGVMSSAQHPSNFTPQPPHAPRPQQSPAVGRCCPPSASSAPPSEHSYMSASPALSTSSAGGMRSGAGAGASGGVLGPFDPACCDGLFDCSALPGMPISDVRNLPGPMGAGVSVVHGGSGVNGNGVKGYVGGGVDGGGPSVNVNGHRHGHGGGAQEDDECCLGLVDCEPPT